MIPIAHTDLREQQLQAKMDLSNQFWKRESLDTLPEELFETILSYGFVKTTRRLPFPTLASVLSRVNRQLRRLLLKYALRSIQINGTSRLHKFAQFSLHRPGLLTIVQ